MFGFNSPSAMRMLQQLHQSRQPEPVPEPVRQPTRSRGRRAPSPPPSPSESEYSDSDSSATSASSSSYESDRDVIYSHVVEKKKCAYVSPAGLRDKPTAKDAIQHLKAKNCPEVPNLKKSKRVKVDAPATPAPAPAAPAPAAAEPTPAAPPKTPKRVRKVKETPSAPAASVTAPEPAKEAPAAPAAATGKAKRAPSAYNLFMKEHLKAGKAMTEIAALWKQQKAA